MIGTRCNSVDHRLCCAQEYTNYHFDVKPEALRGALERFSQFFIAPLCKADALEREVNAVHNEFTGARTQASGLPVKKSVGTSDCKCVGLLPSVLVFMAWQCAGPGMESLVLFPHAEGLCRTVATPRQAELHDHHSGCTHAVALAMHAGRQACSRRTTRGWRSCARTLRARATSTASSPGAAAAPAVLSCAVTLPC